MREATKEVSGMSTSTLRETWIGLKTEVDQVAREAATLRRVAHKLGAPEGYEALHKLQKDLQAVTSLDLQADVLMAKVKEAAADVDGWLEQEWARRSSQFGQDLRRYFADREIKLTGAAPVLECKPLSIQFDTRADAAHILYAQEVIKEKIPLAPERVFKEWQAAQQRLVRDATEPGTLFNLILTAYEQVQKLKGVSPGGRVRLRDLHFQLFVDRQVGPVKLDPRKSRLKEYPRYQFLYDLSQLLNGQGGLARGNQRLVLHVAAKSAAESRSTSVMVEDGRGGWTHFSDIQVEV